MAHSTLTYTHSDLSIDSNLHHKANIITFKLPITRTELKHGAKNPNNCQIDWTECTQVHKDHFNTGIATCPHIQRLQKEVETEFLATGIIPSALMNAAENRLVTSMREQTRLHLPMKSYRPTKKTEITQTPRREKTKRDTDWHTVRLWRRITTLSKQIKTNPNFTLPDRYALMQQVQARNLTTDVNWDEDTDESIIDNIKLSISKALQQHDKQLLEERMKNRETRFCESMSKHIKNIMETRITWAGLTFTRNTQSQEIINHPDAVRDDIQQHFKRIRIVNKSDKETLRDEWLTEYIPGEDINQEWYDGIMRPVELDEMNITLKQLPRNTSPGPSGITYELFQIIDQPGISKFILRLINNMLKTQTTPKRMNQGTIILLPKTTEYTGDKSKLRPITLLEALK
jgi:hypothetical protein